MFRFLKTTAAGILILFGMQTPLRAAPIEYRIDSGPLHLVGPEGLYCAPWAGSCSLGSPTTSISWSVVIEQDLLPASLSQARLQFTYESYGKVQKYQLDTPTDSYQADWAIPVPQFLTRADYVEVKGTADLQFDAKGDIVSASIGKWGDPSGYRLGPSNGSYIGSYSSYHQYAGDPPVSLSYSGRNLTPVFTRIGELQGEAPPASPLPASLPMLAAGLGLFGLIRRRRDQGRAAISARTARS